MRETLVIHDPQQACGLSGDWSWTASLLRYLSTPQNAEWEVSQVPVGVSHNHITSTASLAGSRFARTPVPCDATVPIIHLLLNPP